MQDVRTFLMMGRPGAGKGTQAKLLAEKIGAQVCSSGDRLRQMAQSGTFFGNKAKAVMAAGDLMPEWVSIYLFEDALIKLEPADKIVFEGSGRKPLEAREFHQAAVWLERPYKAIYIKASEEVLRARLLNRAEGRADDVASALNLRFERFAEDTEKSIEYFRSEGTLVEINGEQPIEAVHADILKILNIQ
jgi:adenylate kinase